MANQRRVVLPPINCIDFIDYILHSHSVPTTLVVCSSREIFLELLQSSIHNTHPTVRSDTPENGIPKTLHRFLIPTIHLLATSRTVKLAFAPTLPHLRAFLAVFGHSLESVASTCSYEKTGTCTPTLAILGLVALHQFTGEYSAQGLSRTLANAVDAADSADVRLVLAELRVQQAMEQAIDDGGPIIEVQEIDPWKEQVPLLSNSIRIGDDQRAWAGKTIDVARVVERWCHFIISEDIYVT